MSKIKRLLPIFLFIVLANSLSHAANVVDLTKLFQMNFNNFYESGYCGRNTIRLIEAAREQGIDISNSYVLKIVGGGFLETSGFYTRGEPNQRDMLGYFHMVFVADNYVFDFDLHEPLVLPLEDYIRLQFTPPYEPFDIWGIKITGRDHLPSWQMTRINPVHYIKNNETPIDSRRMDQFIDIESMMNRKRLR